MIVRVWIFVIAVRENFAVTRTDASSSALVSCLETIVSRKTVAQVPHKQRAEVELVVEVG